ncbi:MAG: lysostaphin resistance A-like protein [Candidatus Tyrphobacter sp.]
MENDSTSTISPSWPTRWPKGSFSAGPTGALILALVGLLVLLFIATIAVFAANANGDLARIALQQNRMAFLKAVFVPSTIVQVAFEAVAAFLIIATLPRITHFSLRDIGFRALSARDLFIAILGFAVMVLVVDGGGNLVSAVSHGQHQELAVQLFESLRANLRLVVVFAIFAVVIQPMAEETIFRVFLFNLGLRYGRFWGGAIFSGILFGAAHADAYAFVPLALGGIVLCGVYYTSRNAFASMITHGLFNLLSTALIYFAPKLAGS